MNEFISQAAMDLAQINRFGNSSIEAVLGIRITAVGPDFVCGEMPVDRRTHQPFGLLHGGASIVLAESLGSYASYLLTSDEAGATVAGIEVGGSHVRSVRSGRVTAVARPVRLGRSLHFWRVDVRDDGERLCCAARLIVKISRRQDSGSGD